MSLFQVREWWGVRDEDGAEYTPGALAVGNADNDHSGHGELPISVCFGCLIRCTQHGDW